MKKRPDTTIRQIKDCLEISTRYHTAGYFVPNHWHDYYELEILIEGEYEHTVNGEKRIARRGSAWIMCHLDYHSLVCKNDAIILNISITGDNIDKDILDVLSSSTSVFLCEFSDEETDELLKIAQEARTDMLNKKTLWECNSKGLVESIFIKTLRKSMDFSQIYEQKSSDVLQSVVSYIHKNYAKDLSLTTLSDEFSISTGHLGRIFTKGVGMTVSNYVTRVRIKRACNLLENSELSTKDIADICGFLSIEYFYYVFKKQMKMTPGEYRKSREGNLSQYSLL